MGNFFCKDVFVVPLSRRFRVTGFEREKNRANPCIVAAAAVVVSALVSCQLQKRALTQNSLKIHSKKCAPSIEPGLPDGIFSKQKSQFEYILKGLRIEIVGLCIL
jgi:hypothetical protein